jgi:hypothetical protein
MVASSGSVNIPLGEGRIAQAGPPTPAFISQARRIAMRISILSLGLLAAVGTVRADEESVSLKEVPKAVRAAVKAKFPEGKVTEAAKEVEDGKTVYEIGLEDDDQKVDLLVSDKGKILEVEKSIAAKKLPKAVAATIESKYPKAKIKKAEQVVKYEEDEEEKTFEVILAAEGKHDVEVKLSPKGKVLKGDEEADEDDDKKATSKKDKDDDKKVKGKKDKDGEDEDDDDDKKVKGKKDKDGDKKASSKKDKDDEDEDDDDKDEKKEKGKKKHKD